MINGWHKADIIADLRKKVRRWQRKHPHKCTDCNGCARTNGTTKPFAFIFSNLQTVTDVLEH